MELNSVSSLDTESSLRNVALKKKNRHKPVYSINLLGS
jgi:hypothetical protein